jgi:hypothetical protein
MSFSVLRIKLKVMYVSFNVSNNVVGFIILLRENTIHHFVNTLFMFANEVASN